jgi:phosphoribosylformylglycinamidine cyclo-ligase
LHSNGFSLVRKLLVEGREAELRLPRVDLGGASLGEVLLTPTRIYVSSILSLLDEVRVKGMAHITGGGITENLNRVLPEGRSARVVRGAWRMPKVFDIVAAATDISEDELYRTFNMGIGFCVVLSPEDAPVAAALLRERGETVYEIGEIIPGDREIVYA